jgi:hypothetical protein
VGLTPFFGQDGNPEEDQPDRSRGDMGADEGGEERHAGNLAWLSGMGNKPNKGRYQVTGIRCQEVGGRA